MTFIANRPLAPVAPLVLSAPHGGRKLTDEILKHTNLSEDDLLATSDFGTDELVMNRADIAWISALYARTVVDLNRSATQMDSAVIHGVPRSYDPYVRAGYGVIPRFAERGALVREGKIGNLEADELIAQYYQPYHRKLSELINKTHETFGRVLLMDIHTAPATSLNSTEVVIGTDFRSSLSEATLEILSDIFTRNFNEVTLDIPFSGGHIIKNYADKSAGIETVQIEFNREIVESKNREIRQDFFKKWCVVMNQISCAISNADNIKFAAE